VAVLTDHTEPHKGDTKKFWDKANWQSSCQWHHDVVKQRLEWMWQQGALSVAELKLDSETAKQITRSLRG
jgi:5-methylcytosine-specific restriction protein A